MEEIKETLISISEGIKDIKASLINWFNHNL